MNQHTEAHEQLIAKALFDALTDAEAQRLEAQLSACETCAETYRASQQVLQTAARRVRPEPSDAFWDGYADRLARRMEAEARPRRTARLQAGLDRLSAAVAALFVPVPRWTLQLAAALLLVALGVVIGKTYFGALPQDPPPIAAEDPQPARAPEPQPEPSNEPVPPVPLDQLVQDETAPAPPPRQARPAAQPDLYRTAALDERTLEYIDRSKVLLLGLVNFDPAVDDPAGLDLTRQQALARNLVDEAGALKEDLAAADRQRLRGLIADLEVILLQIANLEAQHDLPAIEMVKSGVDRRAILLKINVEEMRLSAPSERDNETAPRGQPSI